VTPRSGAYVRIDGADELRRKMNRMADGVNRDAARGDMKNAHREAAEVVAQKAVQLVPRRSGNLAATIRSAGTQKSGRVRAGFARVPYAGPIHFGWPQRGISPQPFLYNALDARRGEVLATYERNLEQIKRKYDL
jgi:hypothetical protein